MPLLSKTGVRSPWMPGPLQAAVERVRPAMVIAALVPSVLLGGNAEFVGQAGRPEQPAPPRPAILIQQPVPIPGAQVDQTYAPRDQVVIQPDHTWPVRPILGQQPQPLASVWQPAPSRVPNTDPLRLTVVQVGQQPRAGAIAQAVGIVHDAPVTAPERLSLTQVITGQQPQPVGSALTVGTVKSAPTERLALTLALVGSQPIPGAAAQFVGHAFDPTIPTPTVTPADRTFKVDPADRAWLVEYSSRAFKVDADDRTFTA